MLMHLSFEIGIFYLGQLTRSSTLYMLQQNPLRKKKNRAVVSCRASTNWMAQG